MYIKLLMAVVALVGVSARHLVFEDGSNVYVVPVENLETGMVEPMRTGRLRRGADDKLNSMGITPQHIKGPPGHGADIITLDGKFNLLNTNNHKLDATAFAAQIRPEQPKYDNINTFGVGADYMYKGTVGSEVKSAYTPISQRTDYSALGKVSLFHDTAKDRSLDLSAGYRRSETPYQSFSEPFYGLSYRTSW